MPLLSLPPEIHIEISKHLTPYTLSCFILTSKHLQELLTTDLNYIAFRDHASLSALCWAAQKGYEPLVKLILDKGADIDASRDGAPPLIWAAGNAHKNIVRLLLQRGADINSVDEYGQNALVTAIHQPHIAVCRLLLKMGADPNICDIESSSSLSSLFWAVISVTVDDSLVQLLVDSGARINDQNPWGSTVLHLLIKSHDYMRDKDEPARVRSARILLQAGVDIDAQETRLDTALHLALPYVKFVKLLVEWGANMEIRNFSGRTALHQAVRDREMDAVRVLLENGAKTDVNDNGNTTLMDDAQIAGHNGIIRLLEACMP